MRYARLSTVREWVKDGSGECDTEKLTAIVNKIRAHFFNWYQELSLFLDAVECFSVQRFCVDCNHCNESYRGVTLPRDVAAVEAMWFGDFPISLQSSWREFQLGIAGECDCRLHKFDLPGTFSTQLDLVAASPSKISVRAFDPRDVGRKFTVRGVDGFDRPFSHEFTLSTEPQWSDIVLKSITPQGGVFKERTQGRVVLLDELSRVLGIYDPDETDAAYRRIKITGIPDSCEVVNIRANRRYVPLYGDNDVVESDNMIAFDAMARYLRIYVRSDKTTEDLRQEAAHYALAQKMMKGEKSREVGKATQAAVTIRMPQIRNAGLTRFGRRCF